MSDTIPNMTDDLEFEEQIKTLPDRDLLLYSLRLQRQTNARCTVCFARIEAHATEIKAQDKRITAVESGQTKRSVSTGAVSGGVTAVVIGTLEWFLQRIRIG